MEPEPTHGKLKLKAFMQKVLVADDEPSIADLLAEVISEKGIEVTIARDGRQAFELAKTGNFDLVVSDVMMPYLDGRELCFNLKENPQTKEIPVILMSAVPTLAKSEKGQLADAFILKPFDIFSVSNLVETLLTGQKNLSNYFSHKGQKTLSFS